ncbi:MAG: hypothetical protein ACE5F1_23125, partial [Planctomycetota bacterium]
MEAILENIAGHGTGQVYALLVMGLLTLSIYIGLEKRWRRDGTRLLRHMVTAVCLLPLAVFLSALGRWSGPWIGSVAAQPGALLFGISAFLFSLFFHGETWPSLTSAARSAYYQVTGVSLLVGLLILAFLPGEHPADGTLLAFCVLLMGAAFFLLPLPGIIMGDDPIWRKKTLTIGFLGAGVALHAASLLIGAPAATLLLHLSQIALIVGLFEIHCCLFNWNSVEIEVISGDGRTDRKTVYPIVDHPGPAWEAPIPGENPGKDLMPIVDPESLLARYRETAALLRNRAKNLERILEIAVEINSKRNLQELLDKIVDSIREHLGFRIVLLRVLNRKTQVFEARAFAGLNNDAIKTLSEYRLPMAEYRMMTDERFRISRSYFISHEMKMWEEDEFSVVPQLGNRKEGQWHEMDMLIVPLETRVGEVIGYLSM